ncbi:hypothetical protein NL676_006237 [Syzygium grande]|nr:hypothetical protein NL676_006237 [Syzygium grande]
MAIYFCKANQRQDVQTTTMAAGDSSICLPHRSSFSPSPQSTPAARVSTVAGRRGKFSGASEQQGLVLVVDMEG